MFCTESSRQTDSWGRGIQPDSGRCHCQRVTNRAGDGSPPWLLPWPSAPILLFCLSTRSASGLVMAHHPGRARGKVTGSGRKSKARRATKARTCIALLPESRATLVVPSRGGKGYSLGETCSCERQTIGEQVTNKQSGPLYRNARGTCILYILILGPNALYGVGGGCLPSPPTSRNQYLASQWVWLVVADRSPHMRLSVAQG